MNKFRVTKPISNINTEKEEEIKRFSEAADSHEISISMPGNDDKPQKSFTIPLNDYELNLLRLAAKKDNRSQRYIARKLLVKAIEEYMN
jgi:hypothetical protein